jgi:hypothetical protein
MGQQTMKVAEDVAASEFSRMCAAFRVDEDTSNLNEDELASYTELRGDIIRDICRGALVIDTEGRPVFTPQGGKAITFSPPTGATIIALETHGKDKQISNTVAAMADMTGTNKGDFSRMPARDFQACSRLAKLFLADQ